MRAFFLLVNFKLNEIRTSPVSGFVYFGLPLLLMLLTGVIFMKGPPFERRTVCLAALPGNAVPPALLERLKQFQGVRLQTDSSEQAALRKLHAHAANAVLVFGDGPPRLYAAAEDELFGLGLKTIFSDEPTLVIVDRPRWGYIHYLFPGLLTWTIVVDGLFGMGYSMVHYRRNRFLKKLSLTPLSKSAFVGAQIASRSILAFLQMLVMAAVAIFIFKLQLTVTAVLWLACLTLLGLLVFMGVGFALACAIKTEANMMDTVNAATVVIILVSEIFFSADELPYYMAKISAALPSTQLVRLIRTVVLYNDADPSKLIPGLALLLGWTAATYAVSIFAFKWHESRE